MKKLAYFMLLILVIPPVSAEIYKGKDAEGNVTYSDKETPDSKAIPTPSPNTIQMPKGLPKKAEQAVGQDNYTGFSISSPSSNETIRSSQGNISVSLTLEPALNLADGHSITVLLDAQPVIRGSKQLSVTLNNVDRGSHSIKASVRDKQGKSLISTASVRIHMKRLSSQHKKPDGTPPGPTGADGSSFTPGPQGTTFTPGPVTPPPAP